MNAAVASYILLTVSAGTFALIALTKFKDCIECLYQRDHKPALFSMFVFLAWTVVGGNGIWVKWYDPAARLGVDTPILVLLITSTLFILAYTLGTAYRKRCNETERKACTLHPATGRVSRVVRRK